LVNQFGRPDFLIDTEKLNRKYGTPNPYVNKTGIFNLPKGLSALALEQGKYEKTKTFVEWQEKEGWELKSEFRYKGPLPAEELRTDGTYGETIEDYDQWQVRAVFKKRVLKTQRIWIPPELVRQAPDQSLTLREAVVAAR
jgi:hypothetical protein